MIFKLFVFPLRFLHSAFALFVITLTTLILFPFLILAVLIDVKKAIYIQIPWAFMFLKICGGRLKVTGRENIPTGGAIFLYNHSTFLDIPILVLTTKKFLFYAAKKELGKIPVLGLCFKLVKSLMMPRGDLEASIRLYAEAKKRLEKGDQFMIAPEGTRSRTPEIAPFKSGPFIFAMSCEADLVPIIIKGATPLWPAQHLIPNLSMMTSRVRAHICPKISTEDWTEENRKQKMNELRQYFQKVHNEL